MLAAMLLCLDLSDTLRYPGPGRNCILTRLTPGKLRARQEEQVRALQMSRETFHRMREHTPDSHKAFVVIETLLNKATAGSALALSIPGHVDNPNGSGAGGSDAASPIPPLSEGSGSATRDSPESNSAANGYNTHDTVEMLDAVAPDALDTTGNDAGGIDLADFNIDSFLSKYTLAPPGHMYDNTFWPTNGPSPPTGPENAQFQNAAAPDIQFPTHSNMPDEPMAVPPPQPANPNTFLDDMLAMGVFGAPDSRALDLIFQNNNLGYTDAQFGGAPTPAPAQPQAQAQAQSGSRFDTVAAWPRHMPD